MDPDQGDSANSLADRLANVGEAILTGSSLYGMYRKEHEEFKAAIGPDADPAMVAHLDRLLGY